MKSKLLLLSFLMLLTVATTYAQSTASQAGIGIQGIARDLTNTAIASKEMKFVFTIYSKTDSTVGETITATLVTDEFGVFSYVLNLNPDKSAEYAHDQLYLKIQITNPQTDISDEPLNYVPYAIAASNGVPMGSIMAYMGDAAPSGWILCFGQTWAAVGDKGKSLKAFLGSKATNVPDLRGMFLRGTGTNPVNAKPGPLLNESQGESFKNHIHQATHNHLQEGHDHDLNIKTDAGFSGDAYTLTSDNGDTLAGKKATETTAINKEYTGTTQGSDTGGTETRPVNHGVNYIIKL